MNTLKMIKYILIIILVLSCQNVKKTGDKVEVTIWENNEAKAERLKDDGFELIKSGKNIEAVRIFDSALNISKKKDHVIYYYMAVAFVGLENYQKAIENCNKCIEIDPKYAGAYVNRGICKMKTGDNKGALVDLNNAIDIRPDNGDSYLNRGIIYFEIGDKSNACGDIEKAKSLGVEIPEQLYNLTCK